MTSAKPVNVLVVDDDRAVQRLLADVLTQHGFLVTLERDGEFALKTFEAKEFDLVLLDLLLPGINGYEVARKLRETPKGSRVAIVMISGVYKNALHQKEALERYGAAGFVEKPFKLATLTDTLRKALGPRFPAQVPTAVPPAASAQDSSAADQLAGDEAHLESDTVERTAAKTNASALSIRGDFERRPFPEVLAEIYRWKGTGALLLRREKAKKIVYFRDGIPQFIKSNLLSECLGRVLVKERMISERECEESLKRMKASGRQQGTVLIEMGCISPHNLSYALNLQMRAKLFDVFTWKSGDYAFDRRVSVPPEAVNLELTAAAAIYEGVRRAYDAERLLRVMGDITSLYVHPSSDPLYALQEISLGEDEHALLVQADGRKTVGRLRAMELLSPLDTDRLLYAMRCAHVIELRPDASTRTGPGLFSAASSGSGTSSSVPLPDALPPSPTPPPLRRNTLVGGPSRHTVPFHGVDTQELRIPKHVTVLEPQDAPRPTLPSPAPELSPRSHADEPESVVRERLAAKVAALRKMDFFEVLGVPRSADAGTIAMAYLSLAREHHPDRHFSHASQEIRHLATQIYELITAAHETLLDAAARATYEQRLAAGDRPPTHLDEDVGRMLAAESKFQKGEDLMRKGELALAAQLFGEAVRLYDEEGEFHAFLGYTRFQLAPDDPRVREQAIEILTRAIQLNPRSENAYLFTGYVHKAAGRSDLAQQHFEKAIQANPGCTEALRELSILNWAARLGTGRR